MDGILFEQKALIIILNILVRREMKDKIKVFIEKADDGSYWGTTQNIPGVVSAFGNSLEELKKNLQEAFENYLEVAKDEQESWYAEVKEFNGFEYEMDIQAFFKLIPELKISAIADKAGINASLLRQYATGKARASEERARLIQSTVHDLGRELLSVSF